MSREDRRDWPLTWLRLNGHTSLLGALTGSDYRVLLAIDSCWQAYSVSDEERRRSVWAAIVALFHSMQPKCWPLAIELVARTMDWGDRDRMRKQLLMYTAPDNHVFLYLLHSKGNGGGQ